MAFDAQALQADLERVDDCLWIEHFVRDNYEGDWSVAALRCAADAIHPIQQVSANPDTRDWKNTNLCSVCPYFSHVMSAFKCELQSVRLLRLAPGSVIKQHVDYNLSFDDGEVRLHIPVLTNPAVEFWLNNKRVPMQAGEVWYLNVNLPHRVENHSTHFRVHIVLDCIVNDWLIAQAGYDTATTK